MMADWPDFSDRQTDRQKFAFPELLLQMKT